MLASTQCSHIENTRGKNQFMLHDHILKFMKCLWLLFVIYEWQQLHSNAQIAFRLRPQEIAQKNTYKHKKVRRRKSDLYWNCYLFKKTHTYKIHFQCIDKENRIWITVVEFAHVTVHSRIPTVDRSSQTLFWVSHNYRITEDFTYTLWVRINNRRPSRITFNYNSSFHLNNGRN
jgi:hypothetical protein